MDVEDPVRAGNDFDSRDLGLPLLQDPRHQTGRVRKRPSGHAVLDADPLRGHRLEFNQSEPICGRAEWDRAPRGRLSCGAKLRWLRSRDP
jgi:hypothetical protein